MDKLRFVFIGTLCERKNIGLILDYFRKNKQHRKIELYLIGNGPLTDYVIEYSKTDERVHYLGRWEKERIKKELCSFHFIILPSKEEPFGIVLIEALASGVPCIVSNADGPSEIILDGCNGFVFDLNKECAFDNVIDYCRNMDAEEYKRMSVFAHESCEKYYTDVVINQWLRLIK